jgi:hypothetical protein
MSGKRGRRAGAHKLAVILDSCGRIGASPLACGAARSVGARNSMRKLFARVFVPPPAPLTCARPKIDLLYSCYAIKRSFASDTQAYEAARRQSCTCGVPVSRKAEWANSSSGSTNNNNKSDDDNDNTSLNHINVHASGSPQPGPARAVAAFGRA